MRIIRLVCVITFCHFFGVSGISQIGAHHWSPVLHFLFPQKSKSMEVINFDPLDFMLLVIKAMKYDGPDLCSAL